MPITLPAGVPSTPPEAALDADRSRFLHVVQSDDTQQAAAMLAKNPSLAKEKRPADGVTPLHLARSVAMAQLLLDNGADIDARDARHSARPLRWAAAGLLDRKNATLDLIRFLESKGAAESDIFFAAAVGDTLQLERILAGDPSLIDKQADHNDVLSGGCAPLQIAAYTGQLDAAKLLIDCGANVHDRSGWNNTEPLEKAAWTGRADVVTLLLEHGAKVDGTDADFTHSPLYNAATAGHADVVKILLAHGAASSPKLIPAVQKAMHRANHDGTAGMPEDFKQVLSMLNTIASTQPAMR
jgi:ankyrin repeat protein